jgi:hypothetical protein
LSVKAMPGLKLKPVGKGPVVFRTPKSLRLKAVGCVELMVLLLNIIGYVHSIPPDPSGAFVIGPTLIVFANAELAVSKAIAVAKVNVSFFVISYPCSVCFFIYLSSFRKTAVSEFQFHQEWTMAIIEHGLCQLLTGRAKLKKHTTILMISIVSSMPLKICRSPISLRSVNFSDICYE